MDNVGQVDERACKGRAELEAEILLRHHYAEGKEKSSHHEPEWVKEVPVAHGHSLFEIVTFVKLKTAVELTELLIELRIVNLLHIAAEVSPDKDWQPDNEQREEDRDDVADDRGEVVGRELHPRQVDKAAHSKLKVHEKDEPDEHLPVEERIVLLVRGTDTLALIFQSLKNDPDQALHQVQSDQEEAHSSICNCVHALVARRLKVHIEGVSHRQVKESIRCTAWKDLHCRKVDKDLEETVGVGWESGEVKRHVCG